jgi:hypothetical protein
VNFKYSLDTSIQLYAFALGYHGLGNISSDLSVDKMTALIRRARFIDIVVLPIPGRPQLMTITLK